MKIFLKLLFTSLTFGTVIHVPADYGSIQAGLNVALEGDTVQVASGTYIENIGWPAVNGIKLIGSGENNCIIDGNSQGTVITFEWGLADIIDTTTVLKYFTIQNGNSQYGGGIYGGDASPKFSHLSIINNTAEYGGGVYLYNSFNSIFNQVHIEYNSATYGGGINWYDSTPYFNYVTLIGNTADYGGGIHYTNGSSTPNPIFNHLIIRENTAEMNGAGMNIINSSPVITDTEITGNIADGNGGGLYLTNSNPTFSRVLIAMNSAGDKGAGAFLSGSDPLFINATFSSNEAIDLGGGLFCTGANPILINSILWGDMPDEYHLLSSTATIYYSDVEGGSDGEGNIEVDPLFVDAPNEDYHLQDGSPCIDAGAAYFAVDDDILVNYSDDEYEGSAPEIGAFEYLESGPNQTTWHISMSGSDETGDGSEENPYATIQHGLNEALENDTVMVASGIFVENIIWPQTNGIKLFGSGEDECIIDGNQLASVIRFEEDLSGTIDTTTLISGFTIQNGSATGSWPNTIGGGLSIIYFSSPKLMNVTIANNTADNYGGGVSILNNSNPIFENVIIRGNSAPFGSGGVYCNNESNPSFENVIIKDNVSDYGGGGGISCWTNSNPVLKNVTIANNVSDYGGGLNCFESSPELIHVTIINNSSSGSNDLAGGGGIYCYSSNPLLENVTMTGNSANVAGGIYCWNNSNPSLINSILWNDAPEEIVFSVDTDTEPNEITVWNSDIQGGQLAIVTNENGTINWGDGNINANPLFCSPDSSDYTLALNSPCVGTGQNGDNMGAFGVGCEANLSTNDDEIPLQFSLFQNYPNPFNPSTTIRYSLPEDSHVQMVIYNILGHAVRQIISETQTAGFKSVVWDGKDDSGKPVSAGMYLYKISSGNHLKFNKMVLLK